MTQTPTTKAARFATDAHKGQTYGGAPYETHLEAVAEVLREFRQDTPVSIEAAYLHDTIEDCEDVDADALRAEGFTEDVVQIVRFCSDEEGPNRKTRKALTYARWGQTIEAWRRAPKDAPWLPTALKVKLADRLANVRQCLAGNPRLFEMYRKEAQTFRAALHVEGICDEMWATYDALMASSPQGSSPA